MISYLFSISLSGPFDIFGGIARFFTGLFSGAIVWLIIKFVFRSSLFDFSKYSSYINQEKLTHLIEKNNTFVSFIIIPLIAIPKNIASSHLGDLLLLIVIAVGDFLPLFMLKNEFNVIKNKVDKEYSTYSEGNGKKAAQLEAEARKALEDYKQKLIDERQDIDENLNLKSSEITTMQTVLIPEAEAQVSSIEQSIPKKINILDDQRYNLSFYQSLRDVLWTGEANDFGTATRIVTDRQLQTQNQQELMKTLSQINENLVHIDNTIKTAAIGISKQLFNQTQHLKTLTNSVETGFDKMVNAVKVGNDRIVQENHKLQEKQESVRHATVELNAQLSKLESSLGARMNEQNDLWNKIEFNTRPRSSW
ncbi:hypothetical protein OZX65_06625 [Leuconostocaceae bacterium ESL0723]|nr:hypothetical protein OZX65_06625 [Leuconostocaceae bacterium ESL0723]